MTHPNPPAPDDAKRRNIMKPYTNTNLVLDAIGFILFMAALYAVLVFGNALGIP